MGLKLVGRTKGLRKGKRRAVGGDVPGEVTDQGTQ